jgi:VWFA-related protein
MISRSSPAFLTFAFLLTPFVLPASSPAQSTADTPPARPLYTLHADSRVVLTDVTVTDKKGNPVHGLPQSAFHIFDNNQPQAIDSFEEHDGTHAATVLPASASPAAAAGVYSNDFLQHLPSVLNVVVIDISNINMPDQMYLNYELTKFLKEQPEGQPLAIYLRAGSGCFLVQNFTSDRGLLLAAVHKAIPRLPPLGREYLSDIATLQQISISLSQLPGRKNILWFSGGSTLFLRADAEVVQDYAAWRNVYDELEQGRIAVYPIDARDLTVSAGMAQWGQHMIMNDVAQATGGQAFYNNNGLKEITEHVLNSDNSFYTVTYSPHDVHFDNKWHKVRVAMSEGSYHLSYRSGYFADGSMRSGDQGGKSRTRLLANGEKLELPALRSLPIIFQARVLPASDASLADLPKPATSSPAPLPKKGTIPFSIRYSLPMDAFTIRNADGKQKAIFGVAAVAVNGDGQAMERNAEQVTMTLTDETLHRNPAQPVTVDQQLNLKKGDEYLYLAVWDMTSGRLGTLQIPIEVPKAGKHQDTAKN